jgi:HK97 family phage major capsid protein
MELIEIKAAIKEQADGIKSQIDTQKLEFTSMVEDKASRGELKSAQDKLIELTDLLTKQQDKLDNIELSRKSTNQTGSVFANQLADKVFTKDNIPKIKSGMRMTFDDIQLKAVSDMTRGYSATAGLRDLFADVEAGIAKAPKATPNVLDYIRIGTTNSEIVKWVIKTASEGGVSQTAEGAKFNQVSYKFDKEQASAKKTTAYSKISKENIEDVDFTLNETIVELREDFLIQVGTQVLSGDNSGENHNGIINQATAFARQAGIGTLTGVTMRDVLEHAYLQIIVAGKGKYTPNACLISPADLTKIKTIKDSTGQYVMPLYLSNTGYDVNGIPLIADHNITPGTFLMADFTKFAWFNYRALTINTYDQNEDDVLKDFITIAGSLRAVSRIKTPELGAFVKGTFSTAVTALQA